MKGRAPLRAAVLLPGGFPEGVVAAERQAHGTVAERHGVLDCDDLDAGDRREALDLELPAAAASAIMVCLGGARVRKMPISAPSRSMTPRRSRIMATETLSPALTETMARLVLSK
jgi:hypothetical protein